MELWQMEMKMEMGNEEKWEMKVETGKCGCAKNQKTVPKGNLTKSSYKNMSQFKNVCISYV